MTSTSKLYRRQSGVAWRMFATLLVLAALASPGQQQQGRGHKRDTGEIARQNRITEQILAQFLHRRLFPQAAPQQMRQGQLHNAFRRPWPVAAPAEGWEWEGPGREVGGRDREGIGHTGTGGRQEDSTWDEEYYDAGEDEGSEDGDGGDGQEGGGEEGGGGGEEGGGEEGGGEEGGGGESGGELGGGGDNRGGGVVEGLVGTREGGEEESGGRFYNILGDGFGRVNGRGSGRRKGGEEALETEETENISSEVDAKDCANCVDESSGYGSSIGSSALNRWTMPLLKLGEKRYYLGIFFKWNLPFTTLFTEANWYRAAQYCRYHGMHLASIESQEESDKLEKHIRDYGLGHEHFWTSGTDQGEEGVFFWLSTGRPVTYTNWNAGEPNNFRYENGEEEHCLELWNRDGKGLKWNDTPCSFETFFVCEVQ